MEKPARSKISIFSFLPKSTSFSFSSQTFSPGRDKRPENLNKFKANTSKAFSGPIVSIIPAEARGKPKNGSFDEQEPTSPKVSCIGQIKQKKKICKAKCNSPSKPDKKMHFKIGRIFHGSRKAGKSDIEKAPSSAPPPPSLGQMKRFSSGRNAFSDFNWRAPGGAVSSHRGYYSDEERDESDEDDEFRVPHSAPLVVGGGGVALEARKEVNLWKRRTLDAPGLLQLKDKSKKT